MKLKNKNISTCFLLLMIMTFIPFIVYSKVIPANQSNYRGLLSGLEEDDTYLENLLIINHVRFYVPGTDHQYTNGIAKKGAAWDWIIRNNRIINSGNRYVFG